jgi:tight adherence protein B
MKLVRLSALRDRRTALAVVLLLGLALAVPPVAATAPEAAQGSLKIKKVDKSGYPELKLDLALTTTDKDVSFSVLEDGREVQDLAVTSKTNHQPVAVTLIIDVSGSMDGKPLDDAKAAAKLFIERARPSDKIAVIAFGSTVTRVTDFTDDKQALNLAIEGLIAGGETAVYDALIEGLTAASALDLKNQSMILLSDGGDTASIQSGEAAADLSGRLKIPVSVVTLESREFNPEPIAKIAGRSGGHVLSAVSSAGLEELYDGLAAELHHGYQLAFKSRTKEAQVDIEVTANVQGRRLTASVVVGGLPSTAPAKAIDRPAKTKETGRFSIPARLQLLAAAALAFIAAFMLVLGLGGYLISGKNTLTEQLKYYDQLRGRYSDAGPQKPALERLHQSLIELVRVTSLKYGFTNYAHDKLEQSGLPVKPNEYITLHLLAVAATSVGSVLVFGPGLLGILVVGFVVVGPLVAVPMLIDKRKAAFNDQLPDTLDMIAGSLRAGFGLQQAIAAAGRDAREPTSGELIRVSNQVQMGMSLEAALDKLARRIGDTAFKWVVLAITIHRETGGNLAELFDHLSESLRQREAMRRQISALTAEGRLSAVILIVLPFAEIALLYSLNPEYMRLLFMSASGLAMVAAAIVLMAAGALWLKKRTHIEY